MVKVTIKVEGAKEAEREMMGFATNITGTVAKVLQNGGQIAQKEAKRVAPVDTWFLHDNIESYIIDPLDVAIHSRAFYSGWVNDGTRYQDAQPFFDYGLQMGLKYLDEKMIDVVWGNIV